MVSQILSSAANRRFAAVYAALDEAIAARTFPGCAFGVLAGGKVELSDARGRFTYEVSSPAVVPETIFDLASVSKVIATTAMAMQLHQRGLLNLDSLLGDLLPGFLAGRAPADPAHRVKLRHLLAHSSGLPGYVEFFRTLTTPFELMRACLQLPLQAEPGARAEYSDPGFILLGKALEICACSPLQSWTSREIFKLLSMSSTSFCPPPEAWPSIPPTEEDTWFRHRRIQGEVQDENAWLLRGIAGHAGLFSNVPDLLRFSAEILRIIRNSGPETAKTNLFSRNTVELFAERQAPDGSSRALGWDTPSQNSSSGSRFSRQSIGHLGYSGCSLWIDLDAEIAVVLLTNRTWPDRKNQSIKQFRPVFHDAVRNAL